MGQKLTDWAARYRSMDWGLLYLRMALGASILLHNIGKMQDYNEIINSYPSILYLGSAASFVVITVAEVLLAVLLMLGLWVRTAAALMAAGMLWLFFGAGLPTGEVWLVYAVVYVFLLITGAGLFSFDVFIAPLKNRKSDQ